MKNFDNQTPIFQQIVEHVLSQIAKGELGLGEKMPTVRNMAAEYKVNPNTMQKSLEKLGDMGFLYTERTSGRFVTEDAEKIVALKREIPQKMTQNFVKEMRDFGVASEEILEYVEEGIAAKTTPQ